MNILSFNYLQFKILTYENWKITFSGHIRCSIIFEKIKKIKNIGLSHMGQKDIILYPSYYNGNWRDGIIKKHNWNKKKTLALCRLPAIKIKENLYFILDGYHRLSMKNPSIILLDWIEIEEKYYKYVTDFYNETLKKYLTK